MANINQLVEEFVARKKGNWNHEDWLGIKAQVAQHQDMSDQELGALLEEKRQSYDPQKIVNDALTNLPSFSPEATEEIIHKLMLVTPFDAPTLHQHINTHFTNNNTQQLQMQIDQLQKTLTQRESHIDMLNNMVSSLQQKKPIQHKKLETAEKELQARVKEYDQKLQKIAQREQELQSMQQDLDEWNAVIEEHAQELDLREAQLDQKYEEFYNEKIAWEKKKHDQE